jgi:hypothetical protein
MPGLSGMKEIVGYAKRSESTIMIWIRDMGFPATKVTGSWMSDTDLIDDWRKSLISENGGTKKAVNRKKR